MWQLIEGSGHICHWWQECDLRRITAMTDVLIPSLTLLALLAGLVALIRFARNDGFAAPGTGFEPHDELGPLGHRRRPV
jgi:hypothetical protein